MKYINKEIPIKYIDGYKLRGRNFFYDVKKENYELLEQYRDLIKKYDDFICLLCNSNKGKIYLEWKEEYLLVKCDNCNVISANINECIDNLYDDDGHYERSAEMIAKNYEYRKATFGIERYNYCIKRQSLNSSKINVLDIGSGFGYFLSVLNDKGVKNKGLEIDPLSVNYSKDIGLNVSNTSIDKELDSSYELIVMFDVLEHLYNPMDFCTEVSKKIKKNGYLIAYTPNIHSIGFELMDSKQNLLHPFQHVCFYNEESLKYLADKIGFEIISIDYFG